MTFCPVQAALPLAQSQTTASIAGVGPIEYEPQDTAENSLLPQDTAAKSLLPQDTAAKSLLPQDTAEKS